jgi:hypothetical protein
VNRDLETLRVPKTGQNRPFPDKNQEKPQKPMETQVFPLTNVSESRKVNGGRFFRSRINTGFGTGWERSYSGDLEEKTRRKTRWQQQ